MDFNQSLLLLDPGQPLLMEELPDDFKFNFRAKRMILIYASLFLVALVGNTTVFYNLVRARQKRRSRINLLMLHLAAADLGVTFVFIPVQIAWISTVTWEGPEWACPLLAGFFKAFPLYLSSLVLAVISLDRYYTIKHPLRKLRAEVVAKRMLLASWVVAFVAATPQV
jgi:gonadotropin-releasing hormone receptor